MAEQTSYVGEMMVHHQSGKVGPIVRAHKPSKGLATELTLRTHDGICVTGKVSEFEVANGEEFFSFVDGWFSTVPVGMY